MVISTAKTKYANAYKLRNKLRNKFIKLYYFINLLFIKYIVSFDYLYNKPGRVPLAI